MAIALRHLARHVGQVASFKAEQKKAGMVIFRLSIMVEKDERPDGLRGVDHIVL
jgi:hypothetical protein